jgi:hypothetical protein
MSHIAREAAIYTIAILVACVTIFVAELIGLSFPIRSW